MKSRHAGRAGACLPVMLAVLSAPASAELQWHALAASDYVVQGVSQNRGEASVQGGGSYTHPDGVFGGIWLAEASPVTAWGETYDSTVEVDYYAGYELQTAQRPWTFTLTHYTYPQEPDYRRYDYDELTVSTTLAGNFNATLGVSDNLYNQGETSRFYEVLYERALDRNTIFNAGAGYQDLDPLFGQGYNYWNIGVTRLVGEFTVDLSYIDTDDDARALFGESVTGARWVLSIAYSGF